MLAPFYVIKWIDLKQTVQGSESELGSEAKSTFEKLVSGVSVYSVKSGVSYVTPA